VDGVTILEANGFHITVEMWNQLREKLEDEAPEFSFLEDGWVEQAAIRVDNRLIPRTLWWGGEGSANHLDAFEEALTSFNGTADILVEIDNGAKCGYRLANHKLVEHEVVMAFGDPV